MVSPLKDEIVYVVRLDKSKDRVDYETANRLLREGKIEYGITFIQGIYGAVTYHYEKEQT